MISGDVIPGTPDKEARLAIPIDGGEGAPDIALDVWVTKEQEVLEAPHQPTH